MTVFHKNFSIEIFTKIAYWGFPIIVEFLLKLCYDLIVIYQMKHLN